jgi:hypothetical protein
MNAKLVNETPKINTYQIYETITDDDLTQEHCDVVNQIFEDVCLFQLYSKELEDRLKNILSLYFPKVSKFELICSPTGNAQLTFGNISSTIGPIK